jgi:hypothetical protein
MYVMAISNKIQQKRATEVDEIQNIELASSVESLTAALSTIPMSPDLDLEKSATVYVATSTKFSRNEAKSRRKLMKFKILN